MSSYPLDSRLLTPMVTGVLPASKPVLVRGKVYCGFDFRQRAVAWYTEQQAIMNCKRSTPVKTAKRKTAKMATTPTRVQPARVVKRKANDAPRAPAPPKRLRINLSKARAAVTSAPALASAYTLSPVCSSVTPQQFQAGLDIVLDTKRAAQAGGSHLSTVRFPLSPSAPPAAKDVSPVSSPSCPAWCPIVAAPLACIDRAYCLHSIGRLSPPRTPPTPAIAWAPEAAMSPPSTPPPEAVLRARAKGFAAMRHVQERTVAFGGLRFAVDVCDGSVRVWMM